MDASAGVPVTAERLASIMFQISQRQSYSSETRRSAMAAYLLALDLIQGGHGKIEAVASSRRRRRCLS